MCAICNTYLFFLANAGWAETPRSVQPGDKIISETPTPSASKRRSRWDETPGATPSMTPGGATPSMTPGGATPSMTPSATPSMTPVMMTPGGSTPMGQKAMAMATPSAAQLAQMTPEQMQAFRWEREIDERNRPLMDEELDAMFPPGYKVNSRPPEFRLETNISHVIHLLPPGVAATSNLCPHQDPGKEIDCYSNANDGSDPIWLLHAAGELGQVGQVC